MKQLSAFTLAALALASFSGCASHPKTGAVTTEPPLMTVGIAPIDVGSRQQTQRTATVLNDNEQKPISTAGTVRKVWILEHPDEEGNPVSPSVKYVRDKDPEWDYSAMRHPSKVYIPEEMLPEVSHPARYRANTLTTSADPADMKAAPVKSLRELYNIDDIVVTGFVERSQEPLAMETEAKYNGKYVRIFDETLGWILIPKPALQPGLRS